MSRWRLSAVKRFRDVEKFDRARTSWTRLINASESTTHVCSHIRRPYLTVATACVFMHRFYMRKTVQEFSPTVSIVRLTDIGAALRRNTAEMVRKEDMV